MSIHHTQQRSAVPAPVLHENSQSIPVRGRQRKYSRSVQSLCSRLPPPSIMSCPQKLHLGYLSTELSSGGYGLSQSPWVFNPSHAARKRRAPVSIHHTQQRSAVPAPVLHENLQSIPVRGRQRKHSRSVQSLCPRLPPLHHAMSPNSPLRLSCDGTVLWWIGAIAVPLGVQSITLSKETQGACVNPSHSAEKRSTCTCSS